MYYRSDLENYGRVSKTEMKPLNIILFLLLESRRGADNFISTYSTFNTIRYSYKEFEDSEKRNLHELPKFLKKYTLIPQSLSADIH